MTRTFTDPQIVVLDRGFIYVGHVAIADGFATITQAQCIRRWGTQNGLGELASKGPQLNTKTDKAGTVVAPMTAVIHLIACDPAVWSALGASERAA